MAIIDSLDWSLYERFGRSIIEEVFEGEVQEFKISPSARLTSPSIATILTGLDPEEHKIFSTEDAQTSGIINLPEFAERKGVKSTVVMEAEGARTFLKNLSEVTPVEEDENVDDFDKAILSGVSQSVDRFQFIVCHLRTVDEYLHQGRSIGEIKQGLNNILRKIVDIAVENSFLLIITGDHRAHGEVTNGSRIVPLLILDTRKGNSQI